MNAGVVIARALGPLGIGTALLVMLRLRGAKAALARRLEESGEKVVLGPETGYYQGWWHFISTSTYGAIALTTDRLIFRKPLGADIDIELSQIAEISEHKWFDRSIYRLGRPFLVLTLTDGTKKGFQLRNQEEWLRELRARTKLAG